MSRRFYLAVVCLTIAALPAVRAETASYLPPTPSAAVVTLGHSLGMQVIAEGVETVQQLDILRGMGCNEMQGYFLGRPMPAEAMSVIVGRHLISQ